MSKALEHGKDFLFFCSFWSFFCCSEWTHITVNVQVLASADIWAVEMLYNIVLPDLSIFGCDAVMEVHLSWCFEDKKKHLAG